MDSKNRFETPHTYLIGRAENFVGLIFVLGLAVTHIDSIRWIPFILLFAYIDLIGYMPGAIAYRRKRCESISPVFYILYNTTHNWVVNGVVVGLWCLIIGPEWALLAIPIHLFGDRSIFGNSLKPWSVSFEPEVHPAFARFELEFNQKKGS